MSLTNTRHPLVRPVAFFVVLRALSMRAANLDIGGHERRKRVGLDFDFDHGMGNQGHGNVTRRDSGRFFFVIRVVWSPWACVPGAESVTFLAFLCSMIVPFVLSRRDCAATSARFGTVPRFLLSYLV